MAQTTAPPLSSTQNTIYLTTHLTLCSADGNISTRRAQSAGHVTLCVTSNAAIDPNNVSVLYLYMDWLVSHYTFINLILFVQHSAIFHAWTVDSSSVNARILIQWHNIRNISSEWTNNKMEFSRIDKLICDAGRYIVFIVENSNQR